MQTDDGQIVEPYSVSAGLDYPGIGPLHAFLAEEKRAEVLAVTDEEALNAAFCLTEMEGIIPALESAHALAVLEQKHSGRKRSLSLICPVGVIKICRPTKG